MALESRAVIKYLRLSPEKVRRVIVAIRGRGVKDALSYLDRLPQSTARVLAKAIKSAAANVEDLHGVGVEDLVIRRLTADEGPRLKRRRAGARGRGKPMQRRTTHITVVVGGQKEG